MVVTNFLEILAHGKGRVMSQLCTGKCLFLHQPPEEQKDTFEKIMLDGAQGILVPLGKKIMRHFWSVGEVSIDRQDWLPRRPPRLATPSIQAARFFSSLTKHKVAKI